MYVSLAKYVPIITMLNESIKLLTWDIASVLMYSRGDDEIVFPMKHENTIDLWYVDNDGCNITLAAEDEY